MRNLEVEQIEIGNSQKLSDKELDRLNASQQRLIQSVDAVFKSTNIFLFNGAGQSPKVMRKHPTLPVWKVVAARVPAPSKKQPPALDTNRIAGQLAELQKADKVAVK